MPTFHRCTHHHSACPYLSNAKIWAPWLWFKGALLSRVIFALLISVLIGCDERSIASAPVSSCLNTTAFNTSVLIKGGKFQFGDNRYYVDERPAQQRIVSDFEIDITEVTNGQFRAFVVATGYLTDAERGLTAEEYPDIPVKFRVPGSVVFITPAASRTSSTMHWWQFVAGANWRRPHGPQSSIEGLEYYPVVHVTYNDAVAYATWLGRRLPTELEWEYAARGGLEGAIYAWGDQAPHDGSPRANTWQGRFPQINNNLDGFYGVAPVGCFASNGFALYDMTGNLWEWTQTPFHSDRNLSGSKNIDAPIQSGAVVKVIKGGSFLCSDNYCQRYRPAARQAQDVTLPSSHIGFRTASNVKVLTAAP